MQEQAANRGSEQDSQIVLPRKISRQMEQVVLPALQSGDDLLFYNSFSSILKNATPERMAAIELFANNKNVPSPADHFVDVKLMRIEQGLDSVGGKRNLHEAVFLVDGINNRLRSFAEKLSEHKVMQDPLTVPDAWTESRDMFWEFHVFKNEFTNNFRLVDYGVATLKPLRKLILRSDDELPLKVARQFESLAGNLPELQQSLIEREAELRLMRFNSSMNSLLTTNDFETKFIAAMHVELDSDVLLPLLEPPAQHPFSRTALNEPQLGEKIKARLNEARELEEVIMTKARLFRSGSHWWLRGRYGRATLASGLLKPAAAMNSEAVMNALYMPRIRPAQTQVRKNGGSKDNPDSLAVARRHYYTWAVEYRPLITATSRERLSKSTTKKLLDTESTRFNNDDFFY